MQFIKSIASRIIDPVICRKQVRPDPAQELLNYLQRINHIT
jgi:hypothetical protein